MVILGLGSNLGDRLAHLRKALELLKNLPDLVIHQVSPVYISDALLSENAPDEWNMSYLNLALRCETRLTPYELLEKTKKIEIVLGRNPEKKWGPRIVDIDILAWDDLIQYDEKLHIPHEYLHERPFALWPLTDVAPRWVHPTLKKTAAELILPWGSRFTGDAPLHTKQIQQRIDTPQLVGILNVTPDSFSDGGKFLTIADAVNQVKNLVAAGAEIIDMGAEATGPHAKALDPKIEWQRLEPVLNALKAELKNLMITPKISVDTRHADVAEKSLALGVDWINDVSGLTDPKMREVIASCSCDVVIMHHQGIPVDKSKYLPREQDPIATIFNWAEEQITFLDKNNIAHERIILDVGIGYGKAMEHSLELLKHINVFQQLNTRLLIGHSRKSFLQQFTHHGAEQRDIETVALSLFLADQGVHYLRVHDVDSHARSLRVKYFFSGVK